MIISLNFIRVRGLVLLLGILLMAACGFAQPPSPAPNAVLAILRQYPGSTLSEEQMLQQGADDSYVLRYTVATTLDAAIAYYDPSLRALGMRGMAPRGAIRNNLPVDYVWMYYGCPFHGVEMSLTAQKLQISYTTGPCR